MVTANNYWKNCSNSVVGLQVTAPKIGNLGLEFPGAETATEQYRYDVALVDIGRLPNL